MIKGPEGSDGLPPRPVDGGRGSEAADGTANNASQPMPGSAQRGGINPRLSGLVPGADAGAVSGGRASPGNPSLAELQLSLDRLVADVERFSDLQPLLGPQDASARPPVIDGLPDSAKDYLLTGLTGRVQAMPERERPAAELAISMATDRSPALAERTALLLLPSSLLPAYEQSTKLSKYAARASDLKDVQAVLAQQALAGPPPLPHERLESTARFIGAPELGLVARPKPLCVLAMRIADDAFPAAHRYDAVSLVLGAIGEVQFKRHRVEPLADTAEAASSVEDESLRTEMYEAVLEAVQQLWHEREEAPDKAGEITGADYAHMVLSLSLNFRCLNGDTGGIRDKLRLVIEELPEREQRETAYNALAG